MSSFLPHKPPPRQTVPDNDYQAFEVSAVAASAPAVFSPAVHSINVDNQGPDDCQIKFDNGNYFTIKAGRMFGITGSSDGFIVSTVNYKSSGLLSDLFIFGTRNV